MTPEEKKAAGITTTHRWEIGYNTAHGYKTRTIAPTAADAATIAEKEFHSRDDRVCWIRYLGTVEIDRNGTEIPA